MKAKLLLMLALHGSASFDAWSTNRWITGGPPNVRGGEVNPLYRPFAGSKKMFVAANVAMLPLDIWLLSGKKPKAAKIASVSVAGFQSSMAIRNIHIYNERRNAWRQTWDGMRDGCKTNPNLNLCGNPEIRRH